jgi:hypothetical protein
MPRTRVHNMNVSLDGYAAGEDVTFDARSAAPGGCSRGLMAGSSMASIRPMLRHAGPRPDQHVEPGPPQQVLGLAQQAAGGRDVRLGGGPSTVRQFLQAGLVDFMHLVIVPGQQPMRLSGIRPGSRRDSPLTPPRPTSRPPACGLVARPPPARRGRSYAADCRSPGNIGPVIMAGKRGGTAVSGPLLFLHEIRVGSSSCG